MDLLQRIPPVWLTFVIGLLLGIPIGVLFVSLCNVAGRLTPKPDLRNHVTAQDPNKVYRLCRIKKEEP